MIYAYLNTHEMYYNSAQPTIKEFFSDMQVS